MHSRIKEMPQDQFIEQMNDIGRERNFAELRLKHLEDMSKEYQDEYIRRHNLLEHAKHELFKYNNSKQGEKYRQGEDGYVFTLNGVETHEDLLRLR